MTDNSVSRRLFLSAVAAAPAAPVLIASDRIAIFDPPPTRVRIVVATAASVVGPARYTPEEIKQITAAGKVPPAKVIGTVLPIWLAAPSSNVPAEFTIRLPLATAPTPAVLLSFSTPPFTVVLPLALVLP